MSKNFEGGPTVVNYKPEENQRFISISPEQSYKAIGRTLFDRTVENYLKKDSLICKYDKNLNFASIELGDIILCDNGIRSIINKISNRLYVFNKKGEKEILEFDNKTKERPQKTKNINDFL